MKAKANVIQEKIAKLKSVLMTNLIDSKRYSKLFRVPKDITDFINSVQKSLNILNISVGEITNIFIEDDKSELCKIIRVIYDIAELQLTISSHNLIETYQISKMLAQNRRASITAQNQVGHDTLLMMHQKSVDSPLNRSNSNSDIKGTKDHSPLGEKQSNFVPFMIEPKVVPTKKQAGNGEEICKCNCHLLQQHNQDLNDMYKNQEYVFEESKTKSQNELSGREFNDNTSYFGDEILDFEAEKQLADYEKGRIQKFDHIKNPLVLIRVNEKLSKRILESQSVSKNMYDEFIDKINKANDQKDNFKMIQDLLKQVISKTVNGSHLNLSSHLPEYVDKVDFTKMESVIKEKMKDGYKVLLRNLSTIWVQMQLNNKTERGMNTDLKAENLLDNELNFQAQIKKLEESVMTATTRYIEAFDMTSYLQGINKNLVAEKNKLQEQMDEKDEAALKFVDEIARYKREISQKTSEFEMLAKENRKFLHMFKVSSQKIFQMQDVVINAHQVMKPDEILSISKFPQEANHAYVKAFKELFVHHIKLINSINLTSSELDLPDFEKIDEVSPSMDFYGQIDDQFSANKSRNPSNEALGEKPRSRPSKEAIPESELPAKQNDEKQKTHETNLIIEQQVTTQLAHHESESPGGLMVPVADNEQQNRRSSRVGLSSVQNTSTGHIKKIESLQRLQRLAKKVASKSKVSRPSISIPIKNRTENTSMDSSNKYESSGAKGREVPSPKSRNSPKHGVNNSSRKQSLFDKMGDSKTTNRQKDVSVEHLKSTVKPRQNVVDKNAQRVFNKQKSKKYLETSTKPKIIKNDTVILSELPVEEERLSDGIDSEPTSDCNELSSRRNQRPARLSQQIVKKPVANFGMQTDEISQAPHHQDRELSKKNAKIDKGILTSAKARLSKQIQTSFANAEDLEHIVDTKDQINKQRKVSKPENNAVKTQVAFSLNKNANKSLKGTSVQKEHKENDPQFSNSPMPNKRRNSEEKINDAKIGTLTSTFEQNILRNDPDSGQISETDSRKDKGQERMKRVNFANQDPPQEITQHDIMRSIIRAVKRFPIPIQRSFFYMLKTYFQKNGILTDNLDLNPLNEIALTLAQKNSLSDRSEKHSTRSASNSINRHQKLLFNQIDGVKATQFNNKPFQGIAELPKPFIEISNIVENIVDPHRPSHYFPFENKMAMNRESKHSILKPASKIRRRLKEFSLNVRKVEECFVSHKIALNQSNKSSMIDLNVTSKAKRNEVSPNIEPAISKYIQGRDAQNLDSLRDRGSIFDPDLKKIHHLIFFGTKMPGMNSVVGENLHHREKSLGVIKIGENQLLKNSEPPQNTLDAQTKLTEKVNSLCNYLLSKESAVEFDTDNPVRDNVKRVVSRLNAKFCENHASCGVDCPHIKVFVQYLDRYISKIKRKSIISLPVIKLDKPEIHKLQGFLGHIANN